MSGRRACCVHEHGCRHAGRGRAHPRLRVPACRSHAPHTRTYLPAAHAPSGLCPLLELGIDLGAILRSTKAILLHQMRSPALEALDFGGALMFLLALGGLHLLVGRGRRSERRWVCTRLHATAHACGRRRWCVWP